MGELKPLSDFLGKIQLIAA